MLMPSHGQGRVSRNLLYLPPSEEKRSTEHREADDPGEVFEEVQA